MNGSNSFNICPRCGNSNALSAKYCSRCGAQLKVPEEPLVCHKCRTRNSPMANFCRNCGTTLKVGSETKICPRCGSEVSAEVGVCECGYSFVSYQQTLPNVEPVDVSTVKPEQEANGAQAQEQPKQTNDKVYNTKGGRGWAIVGILFVLLFAYYIVAPYVLSIGNGVTLRPSALVNLDKGFVVNSEQSYTMYGYNFIADCISLIKANGFSAAFGQWPIGMWMITALTVVFAVTAVVHLIVCIVRSFTAKRSKKANLYFLIMAIISTLLVGLITLFAFVKPNGGLATVASWFALSAGSTLGYAIWAIPVYFWFFYLYSIGAKAKVLKEKL